MNPRRLADLIDRHLDGLLAPAERAELEAELLASAAARRAFWDHAGLHGLTHEAVRLAWSDEEPAPARPGLLERVAAYFAPPRRILAAGSLAAVLAALVLILLPGRTPQPPAEGPRFAAVEGRAEIVRLGATIPAATGDAVASGDGIRVADGGAARLAFPGGTLVQLGGGASVLVEDASSLLFELRAGALEAEVSPRPADRPMIVRTPLARATVHGTVFALRADASSTRLDVRKGRVRIAHARRDSEVEVGGGEYAVAAADADVRAGLVPSAPVPPRAAGAAGDRDPALRPFASDSPWNAAIGARAVFEPVRAAAFHDSPRAVVLPAMHDRAVILARPGDPVTPVIDRYTGMELARLRVSPAALADARRAAPCTIIDTLAGSAHELARAGRDGAVIIASACEPVDLRGAGVPPQQNGLTFSGLPQIAGVIRAGEWTGGIRHALSAYVIHAALSRAPSGDAFVWPARHTPMETKMLDAMGADGNLRYGTLLALPPEVDLGTFGLDPAGPAMALARALQDHGVYLVHSFRGAAGWTPPALQLFAEEMPGGDPHELAATVSRLVPLLKVVTNNGPTSPGGGGEPRHPPAPGLIPEHAP
jgi:ferric-dicitrate binding protein FerR (iron transport regulator)